jgi:hypothetical protein
MKAHPITVTNLVIFCFQFIAHQSRQDIYRDQRHCGKPEIALVPPLNH